MQDFRPVQENWGSHSACFIETAQLCALFHDLAARIGTASDEKAYGEVTTIWFEDGKKILDYMETDPRFSAASLAESLEEQGVTVDRHDLTSLIHNIKNLASEWRGSIGAHGELVFYLDAEGGM